MKTILFLLSIFLFINAKSQQNSGKVEKKDFDLNFSNKWQPKKSGFHLVNDAQIPIPGYKFLYKTPNGEVFESSIDKMKCLAADFPKTMPVAGLLQSEPERIPNPMFKNPAIPKPYILKDQLRSK